MQCCTTKRGIDGFLSSFYGFLRRRTDFFNTPEEGKEKILEHFEVNEKYFSKAKEYMEKKKEEQKAKDEQARIYAEQRQKEVEEQRKKRG